MKKIIALLIYSIFLVSCTVNADSENFQLISNDGLSGEVINGIRVVSISTYKFSYNPSIIVINSDEHVKFYLTTEDVDHSFTIKELGVDIHATKDTPSQEEFFFTNKGVFKFYCSKYCGSGHKKMIGTLIIK